MSLKSQQNYFIFDKISSKNVVEAVQFNLNFS